MPKKHNPRRGSLQFWPRCRAKSESVRIRNFVGSKDAGLLGFAGYKVGMTHLIITDNRTKATTKGEEIFCPGTIIECPPLRISSIRFYKKDVYGKKLFSEVMNPKLEKEVAKTLPIPKKAGKKLEDIKLEDIDEIRVNVYTQPKKLCTGKKKPEVFEIALGGTKEDQLNFVKENLPKEIPVSSVLKEGSQYDAHSVTKGKGFQGATKRFGLMLKNHKSEKKKRAPGNLGPWHPAKISFRVPQPGQMGYHTRTEYNKWLLKISNNPTEINKDSGFKRYGIVKNDYIIVKGSVGGPSKRLIKFTIAQRPNKQIPGEVPAIEYIDIRTKDQNEN